MSAMTATFVYASRGGRLVHARDLDPEADRGLACECACPDCDRRLIAHLGQKNRWYFQHEVDDANCNPQPMTLLHRFARDWLATRKQLEIPATKAPLTLGAVGGTRASRPSSRRLPTAASSSSSILHRGAARRRCGARAPPPTRSPTGRTQSLRPGLRCARAPACASRARYWR